MPDRILVWVRPEVDGANCSAGSVLHRQRFQPILSRPRFPGTATFCSMETGQGSSTVTVSAPEILSGKEIQPSTPKAILRTDYRPTPYLITDVHLTFLLGETTRVKSKLSCTPNYHGSPPALALDGKLLPCWYTVICYVQYLLAQCF